MTSRKRVLWVVEYSPYPGQWEASGNIGFTRKDAREELNLCAKHCPRGRLRVRKYKASDD